jgi:Na+:H+ antiporter, NhaC family
LQQKVLTLPQRFRLGEAALPLVTASLLLIWAVLKGSTAFYWPLAAGTAVAALLAIRAGCSLTTLARAAVDGMKSTLIALSILVLVGGLIGVWKAGGTVPAMVYYGLGMANPHFLVPTAFLLSLAVSMMLGTSIGTLSTIGVALMGVAHGVGAPMPLVAGALVSGAVFGDRSSPLSGSLNLNVAMTGTDLRRMLGVLAPTGVTAAALSLGAYLWLGSRVTMAAGESGSGLREALGAHMAMSPWLLLPPVLVLALAFLRVPVRWSLGVGMLAGAALGVLVGGQGLLEPVKAALFGNRDTSADAALARMLSGGGIVPMVQQVLLILVAGAFNGIMEATGMMTLVISRMVEGVRRPGALAGVTMLIATAVALVAANQALSIIVTGRMLRPAYDEAGLSPNLLSRALADSGTVLAGVVPWNLMGIMAATAVGVPVRQWAPYAFLALFLPIVSLLFTMAEERLALYRWQQATGEESTVGLIDKAV